MSPTAEYFNSKALSVCILGILEFEVPMDVLRLVTLVHDVFVPVNPRFSSVRVSDKGVRRWKRVRVNTREHVKLPTFPEGLTTAEYDVYFDEYLTKIALEPLPEDKPLWEIHVVSYPTSKAAGNAIFKLRHCLGDGYSLKGALLSCSQRADDPSLPLSFPSLGQKPEYNDSNLISNAINLIPRTLSSIYNGMCDFGWSLAKSGWSEDDKTPIRSGSEGVRFHPSVKIFSIRLSLDKLKQIKTKLGVTINAVLTGIIFYGARLYMQDTGEGFRNSRSTVVVPLNTRNISGYMSIEEMLKPDTKLWGNQFAFLHVDLPELTDANYSNPLDFVSEATVVVLLNTRNISGYMSIEEMLKPDTKLWGNQFAFLHVDLPELTDANYSNPLDFVSEAQDIIMRKKNSPAVYLTGQCLEIVKKCRGSETAAEYVKGALKNSSLGFTSMIGPVEQMALANHPVKGLYFMATGSHLSLVITALSYMVTLTIGIGAELGFIDSQKFNSCMEQAYDQIYNAATSITK